MAGGLRVGDPAPDFSLPGTGGRSYSLGEYRGNPVVLVFYPGDDSPVCTTQLRTYSTEVAQFADCGAQVLAISPQGVDSHERFSSRLDLRFPLLADLDKAVGRSYGVVGPVGFYKRSLFVVDGAGVVRWLHRATAGLTYRPVPEIVSALRPLTDA